MTEEPCWCGATENHRVLSTEQNSLSGSYLMKDAEGVIIHLKDNGRG